MIEKQSIDQSLKYGFQQTLSVSEAPFKPVKVGVHVFGEGTRALLKPLLKAPNPSQNAGIIHRFYVSEIQKISSPLIRSIIFTALETDLGF